MKLLDFFDAQLSTESTEQQVTMRVYLSYIVHNINYAGAVTTNLGWYTVLQ